MMVMMSYIPPEEKIRDNKTCITRRILRGYETIVTIVTHHDQKEFKKNGSA